MTNTSDPDLQPVRCVAFAGNRRIAAGTLGAVALKAKRLIHKRDDAGILIFNAETSEIIEVDLRGTTGDVEKRLATKSDSPIPSEKRGRGRPKLGVIGREVTLLPRHWDWLDDQPGGASVALRKLVEFARRDNREKERARRSHEAAHRFMSAMAGNLPGFEEALRAFYSGNRNRFNTLIRTWPRDLREHVKRLAAAAARDNNAVQSEETAKGNSRQPRSAIAVSCRPAFYNTRA